MSTNGNGQFRDDELVTRKMRVNGEWQTRTFPVIGGRLRVAHEGNERLSIQTEIVRLEHDLVVAKATVETEKGRYSGTGTASAQRDARLSDSLVELAETRAIARALRFGGFGVEYFQHCCPPINRELISQQPENRRYPKHLRKY